MSKDRKKDTTEDAEKEIRRERKFSLADAIGRAGSGNLKGASPIPQSQQTLMDLGSILENNLYDSEGSLRAELFARLAGNISLLEKHPISPENVLKEWLPLLLASNSQMQDLVRAADVRWGRQYLERPMFNHPGQEDHPDDPYTLTSVRLQLESLLDSLD
ncbi:MAG: hypothetical protein GY780_05710 [bacterium]|nr:hypothetical protein [bacterium]